MKTKIIFIILVLLLVSGSFYYNLTRQKQQQAQIDQLRSQLTDLSSQLGKAAVQVKALQDNRGDLTDKFKDLDLMKFQAVHLTDKTVYFGKITEYNPDFVVLKDIYYIQGGYADPSQPGLSQNTAISLVKRGNELQGPEDSMTINTANVEYVETLKTDSQVYKAILQYESTN